ncbi:MAG: acetyl-CoA carboxylase [Armatimonadota bacterium]|nr:acetyl-CoA carboxylase [Armatimonadota bacterium]
MPFHDDDVLWLLELLQKRDLQEIEVAQGEVRIRVRAPNTGQPPAVADAPAPPAQPEQAMEVVAGGVPIPAPMAGIFYRQPSPDADPFVEEGDQVEAGDVVGLIEVMKLFNEIRTPVTGIIARIVVENEERIEADQTLMYIQPASGKE